MRPSGMKAFSMVWLGQVVSLLGSAMTGFGIGIWAWQETGKATPLALAGFFFVTPAVLISPIAGALVDRWNRRLVMMISDLAAGLSTLVLLALMATDNLEIWHLYAANAFSGAFHAFQWPAYSAAITTMLPKEQYARANGMLSIAQAGSTILAPVIAAFLLSIIGLKGILVFDIASFLIAIGTLLFVNIPQPEITQEGQAGQGSLLREAAYGFQYILARPSLLYLQLVFFAGNFLFSFIQPIFAPLILARTGNNEIILGSVQSAFGIGMLMGGILLSISGGPKRRILGVLGGWLFSMIGLTLFGLAKEPVAWVVATIFAAISSPIINGSNQAIWQAKVAPDVQGRVFSVRLLIAQITAPLAMLLAGPLVDRFFEPGMVPGSILYATFSPVVGTGVGSGMSLMAFIVGSIGILVPIIGYMIPAVRNVEDILPDHSPQDLKEAIIVSKKTEVVKEPV
jgi:MFS family permease